MTEYAERLKEIESEKEELRGEVAEATAERVTEIQTRAQELGKEADEIRKKMSLEGELKPATITEERKMNDREERAKAFLESGRLETRALLSTGDIAKPTAVGGIYGLGETATGIVDDVNAIALTGNGSWVAAYKITDASADDVTDGEDIGGSEAEFGYVTINPEEWGVHQEISNQVKKMTSLDYLAAIEESALIALRATAAKKIVDAVTKSGLADKQTVNLDENYLRTLALGYRSIPGKGETVLYIAQGDLLTLGKVRGSNEKLPLYSFTFDAGTTTSGTISEGGLAIRFRVIDDLEKGTQLFGQPQNIDMPMWDQYAIETNEGGEYFKKNVIGIRGLQTANAGLVAHHGMIVVKQSTNNSTATTSSKKTAA